MPLGWYLAQGLIPLGESSSDDEEGPCELPDGRIVCGPHGLVVCYKCCSDYNFDLSEDDNLSNDEAVSDDDGYKETNTTREEPPRTARLPSSIVTANSSLPADLFGTPKRRGTGSVFPTRFNAPPSIRPPQLFEAKHGYGASTRFVRRTNPSQALIYTDGACLNNGLPNPTAGWAFHHGPEIQKPDGSIVRSALVESGRLEQEGPFGDASIQSSNRAELRAVIAALRFRAWSGEGFESVVIATDSEYVVEGATKWAKSWVKNGWKTHVKAEVKNRDLWELLLGEVERAKERDLKIEFWRIPRSCNEVSDAAAKEAAGRGDVGQWTDHMGLCF